MPVYSYACKSCGHKFDVHQDFSDDSLTICPECQGQLKKVFGTVGISFKGSGFYATDSRKSTSSSVAPASSSSKDSSSTSSDSASKSESSAAPAKAGTSATN
ncbi:FmdB family transcriptional regulator [Brevibacterium sp. LS14]|uniref:FmdB family zinc ribbon protein n=1 Tax=Brevibacterium sp. LS14 TaxID=2528962 RepID=UPI001430D253|nr:FmdB family transcriptional regulator [Brevibacterium sp. LS14]